MTLAISPSDTYSAKQCNGYGNGHDIEPQFVSRGKSGLRAFNLYRAVCVEQALLELLVPSPPRRCRDP